MDEFWEGELDWQKTVRTHPLPSLALAALGGFYLGKRYGFQLLTDLSAFAAKELLAGLEGALLGGDPDADD